MALVSAAQGPSSSSNTSRFCNYHVFLSFRGEDTRKNFTDHLYTALVNDGFRTFRDDDELQRGEDIKPELQKAIKQSRTSVIVFSKDYASSRWCLDELVMILERKRISDHAVLPVFYDVDPSHVRNQTGSLARAFSRHQKTQPLEKVSRWRKALTEVADLAGMVLQNQADGYESKFIKKIVKVIGEKLSRRLLSVAPYMVGMHSRVKKINLWLQDGSMDVGILVMYGIGGIGKTTMAKFVYNSNIGRFEASSFIENIRNIILQQPAGLIEVQKQLLSDILNGRKVKIYSVSEGITKIEDAISSKRVLLVLDDVDHMDQLDAILRMKDRFYPGSKIIITTRRKRLLKAHQVTMEHEVETLDYNESLELFSWNAFGQDHPAEGHGYMAYSEKVVRHCGGLPLALQVLGSSLLGESIEVWKSALEKLEAIPNGEILNKLRISYDSLQDDHDRNLFLHIACFFIGKDKDHVVRILDACDFYTVIGIQNLIDRCLMTIDEDNKVQMHDMIRDMGRGIVRLKSEEPGERSRLWHHKDSFRVLKEKNGTQTIEGLVLNMRMHPTNSPVNSNETILETNAFAMMHNLKLLHLTHVQLGGCYSKFPTGLRWLCWLEFPLDAIPVDFPLESLICLEMQYSHLRQVCKGTKCLPSLKILDLSHSHCLTETTDFSFCPHLEKLILINCGSLIGVHESIGNLERLVYLNIKDCKNLRMLPKSMFMRKLLETLIVSGCKSLNDLSIFEMMRNMESLKVLETDGVPITELWPGRSSCILSSLPCSLVALSLRGCGLSDDAFPTEFCNLSSLKRLDLGENPICSLPNCIKGLTGLDQLSFSNCTRLKSLVGLPTLGHVHWAHRSHGGLNVAECIALEKITYQSFHRTHTAWGNNRDLVEVEYWYKLEPIGRVDSEMINLLGLCNLESMASIRMHKPSWTSRKADWNPVWSPVQGLYKRGVFSTFFSGNEVPGHFSHKRRGSTISFIVPSLPDNRIRGLTIFAVYAKSENGTPVIKDVYDEKDLPHPILTKVRNKSKRSNRFCFPSFVGIPGDGEDMIWLSHWMAKKINGLKGGDEVVVSVITQPWLVVKECGVQLVHYKEGNNNTQHDTTDLWYPWDTRGTVVKPCTTCLQEYPRPIRRPTWYDNLIRDDDDTEEQQDDHHKLAATTASSNSGGLRGWMKALAIAAGLFFSLSLIAQSSLSHRKKRQSTRSL